MAEKYHKQLIEPDETVIFDKRHSLWEIWKNFLIGAGAFVALILLLTKFKPDAGDKGTNWGYIILVSILAFAVIILYGAWPLFKRRNLPERNFYLPLLWMILAVGGWIALMLLENNRRFVDIWTTVVVIAFVVVIVGWLVYPILSWYFEHFILTDQRLLLVAGIINKKIKAIPLDQVNDVSGTQNFWERLFRYGDIVIESAAEFGQQPFTNISDPVGVKKKIFEQRNLFEERRERRSGEEMARQLSNVLQQSGVAAPAPPAAPPSQGAAAGAAAQPSVVERLEKLSEMRRAGELTDEEFQKAKRDLLGNE